MGRLHACSCVHTNVLTCAQCAIMIVGGFQSPKVRWSMVWYGMECHNWRRSVYQGSYRWRIEADKLRSATAQMASKPKAASLAESSWTMPIFCLSLRRPRSGRCTAAASGASTWRTRWCTPPSWRRARVWAARTCCRSRCCSASWASRPASSTATTSADPGSVSEQLHQPAEKTSLSIFRSPQKSMNVPAIRKTWNHGAPAIHETHHNWAPLSIHKKCALSLLFSWVRDAVFINPSVTADQQGDQRSHLGPVLGERNQHQLFRLGTVRFLRMRAGGVHRTRAPGLRRLVRRCYQGKHVLHRYKSDGVCVMSVRQWLHRLSVVSFSTRSEDFVLHWKFPTLNKKNSIERSWNESCRLQSWQQVLQKFADPICITILFFFSGAFHCTDCKYNVSYTYCSISFTTVWDGVYSVHGIFLFVTCEIVSTSKLTARFVLFLLSCRFSHKGQSISWCWAHFLTNKTFFCDRARSIWFLCFAFSTKTGWSTGQRYEVLVCDNARSASSLCREESVRTTWLAPREAWRRPCTSPWTKATSLSPKLPHRSVHRIAERRRKFWVVDV